MFDTGNKACVVNIPIYNDAEDLSFPGRYSPLEIEINASKPFSKYRLIFTRLRTPSVNAFQLAEIKFLDANGSSMLTSNDFIEATKNHVSPLGEEIENLIDEKLNTKHLNFNTVNPGFTVEPSNNKEVLKKIIKVKHVYKLKKTINEMKYKTRIVVKGYMQRPGIDYEESFSPVARDSTIRILRLLTH